MPYGGGYSYLSSKNRKLNRYNFIKNPKRGAVLIEFAFAVPVLFSLIYYVQDLATIKRWHSRLDFSLHCAANMFQNTQNITKKDFARICYASVVGMFGDPEHCIRPFGSKEPTIINCALCVTGAGNNNCKVNWFAWSDVSATQNHFGSTTSGIVAASASRFKVLRKISVKSIYSATQIDPSLSINEGETKIILEISIWRGMPSFDYNKQFFKLYLLNAPSAFFFGSSNIYMNHILIFTPKPGTFDPNEPPQ